MNPFIESEKTDRTCLNFRAKEQAKILFMAISAGKKDTFIVVNKTGNAFQYLTGSISLNSCKF